MNLQISYQEIKHLLSKKVKDDVTIEEIEYGGDTALFVTIIKPIFGFDLPATVKLFFLGIVEKSIVVDVQLEGKILGYYQKLVTKKWIKESHLEWLMREMFDMEGLISIDEEKRDILVFHLDKIEALKKTLEILELKRLYFNELGIGIEVESM